MTDLLMAAAGILTGWITAAAITFGLMIAVSWAWKLAKLLRKRF